MTVQTVTFGTEQFNSFNASGSGTDLVSNWNVTASVTTAEAPLTGALDNATARIVSLVNYTQLLWDNPSVNSVNQVQIATANSGSGGAQSANITTTTAQSTSFSGTLNYLVDRTVGTRYYGFQKQNTSNLRFSTHTSSGNDTWLNGVANATTGFLDRRLTGTILIHSVPNEPTSVALSTRTANTITLTWTAPTDTGSGTILGYRVLAKPNSMANVNANWGVSVVVSESSIGNSGTSTAIANVTGIYYSANTTTVPIMPGTSYDFMVSALNSVTNGLNPDYSVTTAHTGTRTAVFTANTLGGIYTTGGVFAPADVKVYTTGGVWANGNVMVYNGTSWVNWNYRP
jgi:hypothetical protein